MRSRLAMAFFAMMTLPIASTAATSTLSTNVPVKGSVEENCTVKAVQSLFFPPYDSQVNETLDLASSQSGIINVLCSVGSSYKITPPSGTQYMLGPLPGGADHLSYSFQITGGGVQFGATPTGENWPITGLVLHGQNVHHGTYADPAGLTFTVALTATS